MIDKRAIFVLLILLALAGGAYWYTTQPTAERTRGAEREVGVPAQPDAGTSEQSERLARYEKAVLASILAATYGAERGARIDQIETLAASLPDDRSQLSDAERRDLEEIEAMLPEQRKERDASYRLYFQGVEALAAADGALVSDAIEAIRSEFERAGLDRLILYLPAISTQIDRVREEGMPEEAQREPFIEELKNAITT